MAPVALPRNVSRAKIDAEHCLAEVFDGALSAAECAAVVGRYGNVGDLKKVRDAARPDGTRMAIANPRNYSLGVFEDAALEGALWRRISASAGGAALEKFRAFRDEAPPRGLNGRLRILRYGAGERFEPHYDLVVADDDGGRRSLATVLVYLTADFSGGGTRFLDRDGGGEGTRVAPRVGRCVCFEHGLYHAGEEVCAGVKYVLRTDVMFDAPAGRGAPRYPTPPPPPPDVAALMRSCGLAAYAAAAADVGLAGSLENLLAPGLPAVAEMLDAVDVPPEAIAALLAAASEAAATTPPPAAAPRRFLDAGADPDARFPWPAGAFPPPPR